MSDSALHGTLLLPFDTADREFARGFECGRLWALLRADPDTEIAEYVHAANAEMLLRLGEATDRAVRTEDVDESWVLATFDASVSVESPAE